MKRFIVTTMRGAITCALLFNLSHASDLPVPGEHKGEPHAGERRHTKWRPVRSETMDGEASRCELLGQKTNTPFARTQRPRRSAAEPSDTRYAENCYSKNQTKQRT
jgi:hypothetical protein